MPIGPKTLRSLDAKLAALAATAVVGIAVLGVAGLGFTSSLKHRSDLLRTVGVVRRDHGEVDGANYALKFDATQLVYAQSEGDRTKASADLAERVDTLGTAIDANQATLKANGATATQLRAFDDVLPARDQYVAAAKVLDDATSHGLRAGTPDLLNDVITAQGVFDGFLDQINDQIDAFSQSAVTRASDEARMARLVSLFLMVGVSTLIAAIAWTVRRSITNTTKRVLAVVESAEGGDLTRQVSLDSPDALGRMAGGLDRFLDRLRQDIGGLATVVGSLATASNELTVMSDEMSHQAGQTAGQASAAALAAGQISINVRAASEGAVEMASSIRDIADSVSRASGMAAQAVEVTQATNDAIAKLEETSNAIGQVVTTISKIAGQTNLLALNATIEAARAGDAGKGFAVVATEVKDLAHGTGAATAEIRDRIDTIQGDITSAVSAINEVTTIIAQIAGFQQTIFSAVDEQSRATNEIGRNAEAAAVGSDDIAHNISAVAETATNTTTQAASTRVSAQGLSIVADQLGAFVGQFTY